MMVLQHPNLHAVIAFNNHGVEFLSAGNFVDSLHMFQGALKVASQTLSATQIGGSIIEQARTKLGKRSVSTPLSSIPPKEKNHFLYTRGFHVTREQMNDEPLLASMSMFNMALAHHLRSFENPSIRRQSCESALKLYSLACDAFLQENNENFDIFENRANILLASLNNMAQIQHEFGEYDNSKRYLDELYRLATSLPDSTYEKFTQDRSEFLLNISLLKPPSRAAAA